MGLGQGGTCTLQGLVVSIGILKQYPPGNSPSSCLEKQSQIRERPRYLPWYGGPREWGVPPGAWSFTSFSSLCSSRLCFSGNAILK